MTQNDEGRLHSALANDILASIVPPPGDDVRPLDVLRDALARVAWIREEYDQAVREQALEDLELDLAGYLAAAKDGGSPNFANLRRAA